MIDRIRAWRIAHAALVALLIAVPGVSQAFHFPWDQGHDTTDWDDPPDEGPCEGSQCDPCSSTGSPVYLPTGHFIWTETDATIAGQPPLSLSRTYNSNDPRDGMFGRGWTTNCDAALLEYVGTELDQGGSASQVRGYVLRSSDGKRYSFRRSASGAITAPSGRFERVVAESGGNLRVVARSGASRTYSSAGRLVASSNPAGHVLSYSYSPEGRLQRMTNPAGRYLAFTYNSRGRVETLSDSAGRTWRYGYDANGNLTTITQPGGGVRRFDYQTYSPAGDGHTYYQLTRVTDEAGVVVTNIAYSGARVSSYTHAQDRYTYAYNTATRTVTKTDVLASQWVYTYTDAGKISSERDPLGNIERFEFDASGNTTRYLDQLQQEWRWTYDDFGRITSVTNPANERRTYEYEAEQPSPVRSVSPTGRVTQIVYQANGVLSELIDPTLARTQFTYGTDRNLRQVTNALGGATSFTTDASGLPLTIRDPLSRTTTLAYDGAGQLQSLTNAAGGQQVIELDASGLQSATIAPSGARTSIERNPAGRLTSITDASGRVTRFEYDAFGRLSARVLSDTRRFEFRYRADNLLSQVIRPGGVTESYSYDAAKRLTSKTAGGLTTTYSYNARNDLTSATNAQGAVTLTYDAVGRLESETTGGQTVTYVYNAEGERTETRSAAGTVTYTRGSSGVLASIAAPEGVYAFSYDALSRRRQLTFPNGTTTDYTYDAADQLAQIVSSGPFSESLSYDLDPRGLATRETSSQLSWSYNYDTDGALTGASGPVTIAYQYDAAGNRLGNGQSYDSANRLTEDSEYTYVYDGGGNLTVKRERASGARTVYGWNAWSQLVSVARYPDGTSTDPTESLTFAYDALDRRYTRTANGATQRFVYDGLDRVAVLDASGALIERTTFGPTIDEPLALDGVAGTRYLHANSIGSIIGVSGSAATLGRYAYRPFGPSQGTDPGISNPFRFVAREYEADDLYYFRARYYDPTTGRFISEDPIGLAGGFNLYRYAANDPINNTDPTGECPWCVAVIIGGLIGGGIDLGVQLIANGGNFSCVDWGSVGTSALLGAAGSAIGGAPLLSRAGREFSHWIPSRYFRPSSPSYKPWLPKWLNNPLNGNYTSPARHYRHDPFRYPSGWRNMGDKLNPALQQLDRTPDWMKGAAAGGAAGAAAGGGSENCECN